MDSKKFEYKIAKKIAIYDIENFKNEIKTLEGFLKNVEKEDKALNTTYNRLNQLYKLLEAKETFLKELNEKYK